MSEQTKIVEILKSYRYTQTNEAILQQGVAKALEEAGIEFHREVSLDRADRIDFMCGSVGIECKVKGGAIAVTRQLLRYTQSEKIDSIVVLTTQSKHTAIRRTLNNKQIEVIVTMGGII